MSLKDFTEASESFPYEQFIEIYYQVKNKELITDILVKKFGDSRL